MNTGKIIDAVIAAIGAALGFIFGEMDGLLIALIAITFIDYISGVLKAIHRKELSSDIGFKGICKKIMMFVVVALAHIIDAHIIQSGAGLRTAAIFLFIANEGVSLLENAGEMGVPVPEKLLKTLQQLKLNSKKEENEEENKNDT
ncbi:MAG: phage holin family protein [Oscillospiraceae bacterium]|nr:phage holin family protein [Oscillospiraceae bacterium]